VLLRYTADGYLVLLPQDDLYQIVDAMLATGYSHEFCLSPDLSPEFIARLMEAGFLVMSARISGDEEEPAYILLPELHLVRSALFFKNLHVKKSIRRFLNRYELRFDSDFEAILGRCVAVHGSDWLSPPLVDAIKKIRRQNSCFTLGDKKAYPVSFALYRGTELVAGEFGVAVGRVYTSYSGYYDEPNAGTVQLILATRYLQEHGFAFFDLGMPLNYKTGLGATDINTGAFVALFRGLCDEATPGLLDRSSTKSVV
jgi:Leu/Phe-tRNA-protein transferase